MGFLWSFMFWRRIVLLGVPGCMVLVGMLSFVQRLLQLLSCVSVEGRVIEVKTSKDDDGGTLYRARFQYEWEGVEYIVDDEMSFGWKKLHEGDEIFLAVDPEYPAEAFIVRYWNLALMFIIAVVGMGVLYLAMIRRI